MKKLIYTIFFILLLSGCGKNIGGNLSPVALKEDIILSKDGIATIQENYISPIAEYKKYKEMSGTTSAGIGYKVDEYVVWDGKDTPKETGYIITYTKSDGSTMATGTGEYARTLSHDWLSNSTISTTTK